MSTMLSAGLLLVFAQANCPYECSVNSDCSGCTTPKDCINNICAVPGGPDATPEPTDNDDNSGLSTLEIVGIGAGVLTGVAAAGSGLVKFYRDFRGVTTDGTSASLSQSYFVKEVSDKDAITNQLYI